METEKNIMKKTNIAPMKEIPTVERSAEFSPIGDCYFWFFPFKGCHQYLPIFLSSQ